MIGLVLLSHGPLANGLKEAAEMIMGPQEALAALGLDPAQNMDLYRAELEARIRSVDRGQGVLVLTDLFGGSPANSAAYVLGPSVEVLCGASLPMLLEALGLRSGSTLPELTEAAKAAGAAGAVKLREMLHGG